MPSTSNRRVCKRGHVPAGEADIQNKDKMKKKNGDGTKVNNVICNADTEGEGMRDVMNKSIKQKNRAAIHRQHNVTGENIQKSGPKMESKICHKELFDKQTDKNLRMISRHLKRSTAGISGRVVLYAGISNIHGIGIFAGKKIPSGTRIIEYVGELIGKKVADKRERFYRENGILSVYLFKIFDDMIVDATLKGNLARFINHSCSPNAIARISHDRIFIYSTKEISKGEEITFYYNFSTDEHDDTRLPCYCGHDICTKFME